MAIYDVECTKCGTQFEVMRNSSDDSAIKCTNKGCKGKCSKLWGTPKFRMKGAGFHKSSDNLQ